MSYQK